MWRSNSLEKTLMLGKIEGWRRRGWQRMRWLDGITDSMEMSLSLGVGDGQGVLRSMGLQSVGHEWATELNWPKSINVHNKYLCWFSETSPWYVEKKSVCPFTTLSPEDTALPSPTHCILSWLKASWSLNLNKQEQRLHLKTCDWNSS